MEYRKKPELVDAVPIKKDTVVEIDGKEITAHKGDWVIIPKNKEKELYSGEEFEKLFEEPTRGYREPTKYEEKIKKIKDGKTVFSPEQKVAMFQTELNYIHNKDIKRFATEAVKLLPSYFFIVPASSTKKYHPDYAVGEGGLHLHTVSVVRLAVDFFTQELWDISETTKDIIIVSAILHDGWKSGLEDEKGDFTTNKHPMIAAEVIRTSGELYGIVSDKIFNKILDCIETHMGRWNYERDTGEIFAPEPKSVAQRMLCNFDVISSRPQLDYNFDKTVERKIPPDKPEIKDPSLKTFAVTKHIHQESGTFEGYIEDEENSADGKTVDKKSADDKHVEEKAPRKKDKEK